jgi:deoxycytidine triphosphate deaminase
VSRGKIPILTITPESAVHIGAICEPNDGQFSKPSYLSVFVDVPDNVLDMRLRERGEGVDQKLLLEQKAKDRQHKNRMLYSIENLQLDSSVELLISLWDHSGVGGVLPARLIGLMLDCGMLLEGGRAGNISGASYDLSLGDEYFYGGRIRRLTDSDPIRSIEPYDYAIVTSQEVSNLPRDVCGRFDLSVGLFCQGIILSNGPQVDPGFRGRLFCLLFNTSSSPVLLKRGQHYATLEFHKLVEPTYVYRGKNQGQLDMIHYLPSNATRGAINELKKELEQVREESRKLRDITWAILSLILAMMAVWVSLR